MNRFLIVCLLAASFLGSWSAIAQQGIEEVLVYSARIENGASQSDDALAQAALQEGSLELLRYWDGTLLERIVVRLGTPGIAFPGFTSLNREKAQQALAKGLATTAPDGSLQAKATVGQAEVQWIFPKAAGDRFVAIATVGGRVLYKETRVEEVVKSGETRPNLIRVDYEGGESVVQVFVYGVIAPTEWEDPYAGFGTLGSGNIEEVPTPLLPSKALHSQDTQFHAMHGFRFDYDSGYWPGGGSRPGAFPVQIRVVAGAAWARGGDIFTRFYLDSNTNLLSIGTGRGNWWVDYGANLSTQAALNVPIIGSITFAIPYIPNFDMRLQKQAEFNSLLFYQGSSITEYTPRYRLYTVDLVDLLLGDLVPSWVPLSAGAALDGAISGTGTLQCNAVRLTDGNVFTSEWQSVPVTTLDGFYRVYADYDARIDLSVGLHAYPSLFVEVLFQRFELPLGELSLPFPVGSVGMDFEPAQIYFADIHPDPIPDPPAEGEPTPPNEGQVEGSPEPPQEGEATPEGEPSSGEGTPDTEGNGEGNGTEGAPLTFLDCSTYSSGETAYVINDFERTVVPISVPDAGLVQKLEVWVDIYHMRMGDLAVSLRSPSGKEVFLYSMSGQDSRHMLDTTFSDDAARSIIQGTGPYGDAYKPLDALSKFYGENAQGIWNLIVYDGKIHNRGVVFSWSLTINPCSSNDNSGGNPDLTHPHALDYAPTDGRIALNELLRCIQFFNAGEYSCDLNSEDGYTSGAGWHTCSTNSADYNPADWRISFNELLRVIQLYNAGAYTNAADTEDGFAPLLKP